MTNTHSTIVIAASVILAGTMVFFGLRERGLSSSNAPGDATAVATSLGQIDRNLARQSEAVLRLNTTLVQYDFLQRELERLARLDQALAARAGTVARNDKNEADAGKTLEKIKNVQGQVQTEVQRRKDTLMKLIAGLEKNLAASTLDEKALRELLKPSARGSEEGAAAAVPGTPASRAVSP